VFAVTLNGGAGDPFTAANPAAIDAIPVVLEHFVPEGFRGSLGL